MNLKVGTHNESNRIAWLEKVLRQIPAGYRILDAGAGEQQLKGLCSHLKYVSQDFARYDGKGNKKGLQMGKWNQSKLDIVSDITSIPEPNASFDAIMCVEVFEHLPNPLLAIMEFSRLLKTGGHLIITAPFCSLTHFAPYHFYTGFNSYFFEKHLRDFGFDVLEVCANGNFFEVLAQEIRRMRYVLENYTDDRISRIEEWHLNSLLKMLERYSKNDKGSSDLLHFGCFVMAIKRQNVIPVDCETHGSLSAEKDTRSELCAE